MNKFQRIKEIVFGVALIALAVLLAMIPEDSILVVAFIISLSLLIYGARLMWYYFSMARHMVGGKATLYQGIIVLDIALFSFSFTTISTHAVAVYLMLIFAISGGIDILRSVESKKNGVSSWKWRFVVGFVRIAAAIGLLIAGAFFYSVKLLVIGFCADLVYLGIVRIVRALRRTAIIYIQ